MNWQIPTNIVCVNNFYNSMKLGGGEGLYQQYGSHGGIYGRQQQQSNTLGRPSSIQQQQQQFLPRQNTPPGSIGSRQSNTPPSAINNPQQHAVGQQGMMTRPSQRPPSPPLPPPPMGGMPQNSQGQGYEGQQQSAYMQQMYSRQSSELSANPSFSSEKSGILKNHYVLKIKISYN